MKHIIIFLLAMALTVPSVASDPPARLETYEADIIIYGGTSAAITAAIQANQMGKKCNTRFT